MSIPMILILAVGLSMDAFAISVTNGMCYKLPLIKTALYSGLTFGIFQGLMPMIGLLAGRSFSRVVERYDHWLALFLLGFIGARMIFEAVKELKDPWKKSPERAFSVGTLLLQGVATSIDALAIGVGLGVVQADIIAVASIIAATTFLMSFAGVVAGRKAGDFLKEKAEIFGGLILIGIGIRIFVEHMVAAG